MVSPDRQDNHVSPELVELRHNPRFIFYGVLHYQLNLQGIKPLIASFEEALDQSSGRSILFLEDVERTKEEAIFGKWFAEEYGLTNALLAGISQSRENLPPTAKAVLTAVSKLNQMISALGIPESVQRGFLPLAHLREFLLYLELDRLRTKVQFEVEFEAHEPATLQEIEGLKARSVSILQETNRLWVDGKFEEAIRRHRANSLITHQVNELRAPDTFADLKGLAASLLDCDRKGILFTVFGGAHEREVVLLKNMFNENIPVQFDVINFATSPEMEIESALQNGQDVKDEVYARHLLHMLMLSSVETFTDRHGRLFDLARNYEMVYQAISEVVRSFSLEEISDICKRRMNVYGMLDVLRVHNLGASLLPYISGLFI